MFLRSLVAGFCLTITAATAQQANDAPVFEPLSAIPRQGVDLEAADLGRMLFFDPRLSGDASTSCAECHDPIAGWTDGSDLARGYPGTKHWRNSQTIVNTSLIGSGLHWDGFNTDLLDQVHGAMDASFVSNIEVELAEERMRQIPEYRNRFQTIWGEEPRRERMYEAIAAFEGTLISADSPFDLYHEGDESALSAEALRGQEIFAGKGNCIACHNGPLLTDELSHNITVPANGEFAEDPLRQITFRYVMRARGLEQDVYNNLDRDPGRFSITGNPDELGAFRTPPLRYLKYTAPYMHNGVFFTLEEVVEFYNIGGTEDVFGTKSPLMEPLDLTPEEKQDLVAFLESLSGSEILMGFPDLPDYDTLPAPNRATLVTAARLKGIDTGPSEPVSASQSGLLPEAPPGLRIDTTEAQQSGLSLVPRKADDSSAGDGSEGGLTISD